MRRIAKIVLPVLVLAVAIVVSWSLIESRTEPEPNPPRERVWTVSVVEAGFGDVRPELTLYGEVVAGREVGVSAQVAGRVREVGPNFIDGASVREGELLVAIDPFDYQAALDERRAQLAEARARLREIEARRRLEADSLGRDREQLVITARDRDRIEKLHAKGTASSKALDNAAMAQSRQEQLVGTRVNALAAEAARIDQQRAVIARLDVAVRRARRDLERTRVTAPFDAFVLETNAEIGNRLGANDPVARLIDANRLEARFHLSDAQFGRILAAEGGHKGRQAEVEWRTGASALTFSAVVDRASPVIDAASGGVDLYAPLIDAGPESPLRPGAFVSVRIADRTYVGVARLPRTAVHGGATVYVVVEGRLAPRDVEVAARIGDEVLVSAGLVAGERVVTTRFAEIGPGVRVEVR